MTNDEFSINLQEILKNFDKLQKFLVEQIILNFREWCETLTIPKQIEELLWGINREIQPFHHKINGNIPDLAPGKNLSQKGYGIDGLLEIKHKARRICKDDLLEYAILSDYLKYFGYCMRNVKHSNKIDKIMDLFTKLKNYFEVNIVKKTPMNNKTNKFDFKNSPYSILCFDDQFDKILNFFVYISLSHLENMLSKAEVRERDLNDIEESKFQVDLHLHSHYSDCSTQSVGEILCKAKEIGLKTLSLTDHNNFDGVCKAIKISSIFNIDLIPGIEIATGIKKSNDWIEDRRDILVYFPELDKFQKWALSGFDLCTNELLAKATDRIHNKKFWGNVPIEEVIKWADQHGGISIIAHLGYYNYETKEKIIELLEKGIKGIEIFNLKYLNYSHYGKNSLEEVIELYFNMIRDYTKYSNTNKKPIFTLGSDSHSLDSIGKIKLKSNIIQKINSFLEDSETVFSNENDHKRLLEQLIMESLQT